jgi:DNA-binding transcriptional LysR family regulator
LTAASQTLGLVPLRLARALSPSLGLRILELPLEVPPLTMSLVWHERHQQDAAHRWFREFVAPNAVRPNKDGRLVGESEEGRLRIKETLFHDKSLMR